MKNPKCFADPYLLGSISCRTLRSLALYCCNGGLHTDEPLASSMPAICGAAGDSLVTHGACAGEVVVDLLNADRGPVQFWNVAWEVSKGRRSCG